MHNFAESSNTSQKRMGDLTQIAYQLFSEPFYWLMMGKVSTAIQSAVSLVARCSYQRSAMHEVHMKRLVPPY